MNATPAYLLRCLSASPVIMIAILMNNTKMLRPPASIIQQRRSVNTEAILSHTPRLDTFYTVDMTSYRY